MDDSRNFKGAKMNRIVEEELDSAKKRIQTKIKGLNDFDSSNVKHVTDFSSDIDEELALAKKRIQTRVMGIEKEEDHNSLAYKQLKLGFRGKISEKILTGEEIKGEGGVSIEVALVDASTGNLVEVGPEASLKVEILLLKGDLDASEGHDWTAEEFEGNIVRDTKGKKSLLSGSTCVKLQRGIGVMKGIKFINRASERKPPEFCLGARVVDMVGRDRIKEARTNPFTVGNYRKKYFKKDETPSWTGGVSQLVNIYKGGEHEVRLKVHNICTVGDFLIQLLRDPERLQGILQMKAQKKWRDTIKNARACRNKRIFCYKNMIIFDVSGNVRRLYSSNQWTPSNTFSKIQKALAQELLATACKNWEDVDEVEDKNTLGEPSSGLLNTGTSELIGESSSQPNYWENVDKFEDENSLWEPSSGLLNTGTSEMIGESSSQPNYWGIIDKFEDENSLQEPSSGLLNSETSELIGESSSRPNLLNSGTQTDSNSFSIDDVPIDVPMFPHIPGSSPNPQNLRGLPADMHAEVEKWRHWHSREKWNELLRVSKFSFFLRKIASRCRNQKRRRAH